MNSLTQLAFRFGRNLAPWIAGIGLASTAAAQLAPKWTVHQPVGTSLSSGVGGFAVEPSGISFITGTSGPAGDLSVLTMAIGPDGSPLWTQIDTTFTASSGLALGPGNRLYVAGSALRAYDRGTGAPQLTTFPLVGTARSVVADPAGRVFTGGTYVGDGLDVIVQAFDSTGLALWSRTWDGPAAAPFSNDSLLEIALDPQGNLVAMMVGTMSSLHTDFVLLKMDPGTGELLWETVWGTDADDAPVALTFDEAANVYVTGSGLAGHRQFATIKVDGTDGQVLWHAFDSSGLVNRANSLTLDGEGGLYIIGYTLFVGDHNGDNLDLFLVKRDALTGQPLWTYRYGSACLLCNDLGIAVRVDAARHVLASGSSTSPPYETGALLLFALDADTGQEVDRGVAPAFTGSAVLQFDGAGNLFDGGQSIDPDTGETSLTVTKWPSLLPELFSDGFESGDLLMWSQAP